jgi:hypothetical protein
MSVRGPFGRVARPLLIALLAGVAAAVAAPASAVEHAAPFESRLQGALDAVVAAGAPARSRSSAYAAGR